jgi:hypothetical protein
MEFDGIPHRFQELPSLESQIKLGYTLKGCTAHPFNLTLKDFCNLVVLGERAKDVYHLFLSQLCDQLQLPIIVIKERGEEAFESLICETPVWHLDLTISQITLNPLDFLDASTPSPAGILTSLLSDVYELSPKAETLLHVAVWNTIQTSPQPSIQELQRRLSLYREHTSVYDELSTLMESIAAENLFSSFDTLSLSRFHSTPTIISIPSDKRGYLIANLLLLKLLVYQSAALPPLLLFNSTLNPRLLELLFKSYAVNGDFLLLFDSKGCVPTIDPLIPHNLVISRLLEASHHYQELSDDDRRVLRSHRDIVAVKLFGNTPQLVNIF